MTYEQEPGGIGALIGGVLKRGMAGVVNQGRTARVRLEITGLNGEKEDLFSDIGKKVYALYESGLVRNAELLDICSRVRHLDLDIAEKERYLDAINPQEYDGGAMPPAPYEGGIEDLPHDS